MDGTAPRGLSRLQFALITRVPRLIAQTLETLGDKCRARNLSFSSACYPWVP